jgi:hypothetical protein
MDKTTVILNTRLNLVEALVRKEFVLTRLSDDRIWIELDIISKKNETDSYYFLLAIS